MTIAPATTAASSCETEGPRHRAENLPGDRVPEGHHPRTPAAWSNRRGAFEANLRRHRSCGERTPGRAHTLVQLDAAACLQAMPVNHDGILRHTFPGLLHVEGEATSDGGKMPGARSLGSILTTSSENTASDILICLLGETPTQQQASALRASKAPARNRFTTRAATRRPTLILIADTGRLLFASLCSEYNNCRPAVPVSGR
jgi:hypothetical protein